MRTLPGAGVVEARQQIHERRLAAPRATDDREALTGGHPQRHIAPGPRARRLCGSAVAAWLRVGEGNLVELHLPAHPQDREAAALWLDRLIQQLKQALAGGDALLQGPATPTSSRSGCAMPTSAVKKPSRSPMLMRPWMASAIAIESTNARPTAATSCTIGLETPCVSTRLHVGAQVVRHSPHRTGWSTCASAL